MICEVCGEEEAMFNEIVQAFGFMRPNGMVVIMRTVNQYVGYSCLYQETIGGDS